MDTKNIRFLTGGSGRSQLIKKLLNMLYTRSEIMKELGLSAYNLKLMIEAGAPVVNEGKEVWIHGTSFAKWFAETRKQIRAEIESEKKQLIEESDILHKTYCLGCKKYVYFAETHRDDYIVHGICSDGHHVARFLRRETK